MSFRMLQADVLRWAKDKDLLHSENADRQFMKFIEEVFEFRESLIIIKNVGQMINQFKEQGINVYFRENLVKDMMLEMGDIFVTLIILCEQIGIDPEECLQMAYEKIKDRSGKTINGTFIKEEDL
ncbi:MazG-like family protein [Anaerococcus sp. Marseille-P3915]|uniref:MazG-like family protein n=1 Tax=Anaerococcus sp. Marseille-P3915 TaxID=2057799 RepID=UPI000D0B22F7|nr:MazG-like family protein [Anaerococcus sp. Marseille-P3915]